MTAKKDSHPENAGGAPTAGLVEGGVPPTADEPSEQAKVLNEQLVPQRPAANTLDAEFNPTTPDGSPPPNNLPGPHGPQGVEHLQTEPKSGSGK